MTGLRRHHRCRRYGSTYGEKAGRALVIGHCFDLRMSLVAVLALLGVLIVTLRSARVPPLFNLFRERGWGGR